MDQNALAEIVDHRTLQTEGISPVVTCLLLSGDRIIAASDDNKIRVFSFEKCALEYVLEGHSGGVWAIDVLGDMLVSGSTDTTVRIWDLLDGRCTHTFKGHTSTVRCIKISRREDGAFEPLVITGSRDSTLRVWKLPGHEDDGLSDTKPIDVEPNPYHKHLLKGHTEAVRGLAVHGHIAISGSYDASVRVWDIETGKQIWCLLGHTQKVYSVAYDPARRRAYSGSMDSTTRVWNTETGECVHILSGHTSLVGLISLSPNYLVTASADGTLRVWNPDTGELLQVMKLHKGAITAVAHDDDKVISASDGGLFLWSTRDTTIVRDMSLVVNIVRGQSVWQIALDGRRCVAASSKSTSFTSLDTWSFTGQLEH